MMTDEEREQYFKDYKMKKVIFSVIAFVDGMTPQGFVVLVVIPTFMACAMGLAWLIL